LFSRAKFCSKVRVTPLWGRLWPSKNDYITVFYGLTFFLRWEGQSSSIAHNVKVSEESSLKKLGKEEDNLDKKVLLGLVMIVVGLTMAIVALLLSWSVWTIVGGAMIALPGFIVLFAANRSTVSTETGSDPPPATSRRRAPSVERALTRRRVVLVGGVLMGAALVAIIAYVILRHGGDEVGPELGSVAEASGPSISGNVVDSSGNPVPNATVRVVGPINATESAKRREVNTNDKGDYRIDNLPLQGAYDLHVDAEGFESSYLVSGQQIDEVAVEDFKAPQVVLKRKPEVDVSVRTSPTGFVFGQGVAREDVPRVLMAHGIIKDPGEINPPEEVTRTGSGWTTYIRDGQTVSTVPANYTNEPFWRVTFKKERSDGLKEIFVQRKCGNVSVPPGVKIPKPTPSPQATPTATQTPTATSTPRKGVTPTKTPTVPVSTPSPTPTSTKVPPTSTPRPTQTAAPTQTGCPCPSTSATPANTPTVLPTPVSTIAVTPTPPPPTPTSQSQPPGATPTPIW